jgi:hypothetical protein
VGTRRVTLTPTVALPLHIRLVEKQGRGQFLIPTFGASITSAGVLEPWCFRSREFRVDQVAEFLGEALHAGSLAKQHFSGKHSSSALADCRGRLALVIRRASLARR